MAEDDDRKLFEAALGELSRGAVFRGKYGGPAESQPAADEDPTDQKSREELQRLREEREMARAFRDVERIDQRKYHVREPAAGDAEALRAEFEAALAPPAVEREPQPAPPAPRPLAEKAPDDVHTLNLRGFEPDVALGRLGLFVDLASKDGHELVRVRVGSNPPLLKALRGWFEGPGLSYVERLEVAQAHGDAAIFAQIRRTTPP